MYGAHAQLARDLRVGIGHADGAAFVAGRYELRARGDHGVGDGKVAAADQTEDVPWSESSESTTDCLGN